MMFYIGLAIGVMVGSLCTTVLMALVIAGKQADERINEFAKLLDGRDYEDERMERE